MLPGKGMPCFPIFEDNQGAAQLSQNPVSNANSKHVDVRHHFFRELVRQGGISVSRVPSEYQHADILTKALAFDVFAIHRRLVCFAFFAVDRRIDVCILIYVYVFVRVRLLVRLETAEGLF